MQFQRHPQYESWSDWRRAWWSSDTTSLHVVPHPAHFLVFDYDVRDDHGREEDGSIRAHPPAPCLEEHGGRGVCVKCWKSHVQPMIAVLDECIRAPLGLSPADVLYIYSGGGGLHIWYKISGLPEKTREIMAAQDTRAVVLEYWLQPVRMRGLKIALDGKVTKQVAAEGHSAHAIRLPFSLHDSTGRVAIPLRLQEDGTTLELPLHLQAESAAKADFAQRLDLMRQWATRS